MTPDAERTLLRHVLETPDDAIPPPARAAARVFVLDTLAVGVAGTGHENQPGMIAAASRWGTGSEATVWGQGTCLPAAQAAFVTRSRPMRWSSTRSTRRRSCTR
ncbi:MmgE/PrpD family protein [Elioraea sp.]|uniref:MmgE/PrpD family protein n=1 Tax=Elioraea sp. TaxID=2185103 RepID=UPI0035B68AAB